MIVEVVKLKDKESISKEFQSIAGMKLLVFGIRGHIVVIGALEVKECERFYESAYRNGGKDFISADYKEFIEQCKSEDFDINFHIYEEDIKYRRNANEEDLKTWSDSMSKFLENVLGDRK